MSKKVVKYIYKLLGLTMLILIAIVTLKSWDVTNAAEIIYEPVYNQTEARSMLEQINEFRKSEDAWYWNEKDTTKIYCNHLQDLVYDYELEKVAMQRAAEIAINWDHIRPDGREPWTAYDDCGYVWHYTVSENIAVGQTSAGMAFTAWREDNDNYSGQGHRRNMLNSDVKAIGIACVTVNGIKYWVQELAGNTPTATETVAADTAISTKVQVSDSDITFVSCQNEELSLDIGESISVPQLIASVKFSGAWPSGKTFSVCIPGVFDTADNEYVSISDGTVVGLKAGTGTITGMFLGQSLSLAVSVTGNSALDPEIVYLGDVDGDKQITPKDVTVMRRALADGWDVTVDVADGDVDGDGIISPKDVTLLRRFLAGGWGVVLPLKNNQNIKADVEINETNFPDEIFRKFVADNYDIDGNNYLDSDEISDAVSITCVPSTYAFDELNINKEDFDNEDDYDDALYEAEFEYWYEGKGVKSFKGIEFFTNLRSFSSWCNYVSELDLSENKNLTFVHCTYSHLNSIDVSKCKDLEHLNVCGNNLSEINVNNNEKLEALHISFNNFTSIDVSDNPELEALACDNNKLLTIDVSNNLSLHYLSCYMNNLEELNISNNINLSKLFCHENKITRLDVSNTKLTRDSLYCDSNVIVIPFDET